MKNIILFLTALILILSCNKEKSINKINPIEGKLKLVTEYPKDSTSGLVRRYYYYYDTIGVNLDSIVIYAKYAGNDMYVGTHSLKKLNNNTLIYTEATSNRKFKIVLNDKQIIEIKEIDSVQLTETTVTKINFYNGNVDTIFDTGYFFQLANNIKIYNFQYIGGNCISYSGSWIEQTTGYPIEKTSNYLISYSSINNPSNIRFQIPGSIAGSGGLENRGVLNFIVYMLGINGYYIVYPNTNLIDSFRFNGVNLTTYNYMFANNKITKLILNKNTIDEFVNIMEYY